MKPTLLRHRITCHELGIPLLAMHLSFFPPSLRFCPMNLFSLALRFLALEATATLARNISPSIRTESDSVTAYAPSTNVQCPDLSTTPLIRLFTPENQTLHPEETKYVTTRQNTTISAAWKEWLGDGSSLGYNITDFGSAFPKVGIVIPGGGLRAAQYGASSLLALDARNASSKAAGTGGLLQVSSYIAGLSGMSLYSHHLQHSDGFRRILVNGLSSVQ